MNIIPKIKRCKGRCGQRKSIDNFVNGVDTWDGYLPICKDCCAILAEEQRIKPTKKYKKPDTWSGIDITKRAKPEVEFIGPATKRVTNNNKTIRLADRRGKRWTQKEDEFILDYSKSEDETALLMGRTGRGVGGRREKLQSLKKLKEMERLEKIKQFG